jgi:hypothetical protein
MLNDKIKKKAKLKFQKIVLFQITVIYKEGNINFPFLISSYEVEVDPHYTSRLDYFFFFFFFCKNNV